MFLLGWISLYTCGKPCEPFAFRKFIGINLFYLDRERTVLTAGIFQHSSLFTLQLFPRSPKSPQTPSYWYPGIIFRLSAVPQGYRSPLSSGCDVHTHCQTEQASTAAHLRSAMLDLEIRETTTVRQATSEVSSERVQDLSYGDQVKPTFLVRGMSWVNHAPDMSPTQEPRNVKPGTGW